MFHCDKTGGGDGGQWRGCQQCTLGKDGEKPAVKAVTALHWCVGGTVSGLRIKRVPEQEMDIHPANTRKKRTKNAFNA